MMCGGYNDVYFDTEFIEDGDTITPLSIGLTTNWESYDELYLVFSYEDTSNANEWVQENVLPHLYTGPYREVTRTQAAGIIEEWVMDAVGKPQFWADYAAYDWVLLCQLYGKMIDLPDTFPMFCNDVQNLKRFVGYKGQLPESEIHNALEDAKITRQRVNILYDTIEGFQDA